ncbi:MAG TPA: 50S ribosomal protein L15e [Candidatus Bathyarchaeia archaeon]|nr:50S ribosomal protein L15e [Candidatus Bathyarchaeia archaeon]
MSYSHLADQWREKTPELKEWLRHSVVSWRKEPVVKRIPYPTRLDRARRLGYKAKQGIVLVRVRVRRGGAKKPRPVSGRRQKALGVTKFTRSLSLQRIAEKRANRKYVNLSILDSYYLYSDGIHHWYEVILADKSHPALVEWFKEKNHRAPSLPIAAVENISETR